MKQKISIQDAQPLVKNIIMQLAPFCQRIEAAGSYRRQKPELGDIEIVAVPLFVTDMFGDVSSKHLLDTVDWESRFGKIVKGGHKYKQIELFNGITLDLFIVTPPAQWGIQFMIRTGSAEFSRRLVTSKQFGGLMPSCYKVKDGAIWKGGKIISTPDEKDVFALLGIDFIPPESRTG